MDYLLIYYSIGDWGANDLIQNVADNVALSIGNYSIYSPPVFFVSLGDNFYENGVTGIDDEKWKKVWFDRYISPYPQLHYTSWFSVLGNHDYLGGMNSVNAEIEMTTYSKNWVMPENEFHYYDKKSNTSHIFIDTIKLYPELYDYTTHLYTQKDAEKSILKIESMLIEANKKKSKWIFVYGHYQLFSNAHYGNYDKMIQLLLPLLQQYKVNVYFSGHDHSFQLLKYDNLYFCVNGAGAYKSQVYKNNSNIEVRTFYSTNNNGFLIHKISDKHLNLQFVNSFNIVEFDYNIPHPGLEPGSPR